MTVRRPSVAGQFYEGTRAGLERELSRLLDKTAEKVDCLGAVSPHAGYVYSGAVAGKVLSRVRFKESFIILGPNHTGMGAPFSIMAEGTWQTPLNGVPVDAELAGQILKSSKYIEADPAAHRYEHSIEVQLPFLQYLNSTFKFVPIAIAAAEPAELKAVGKEVADAVKRYAKGVVIITSSDMTHYESRESAEEKDRLAIDAILALDEDRLLGVVEEHGITMCGVAPAAVMLSAIKGLGAKKAELVDYRTSGDASGDYSSVVGYAGIIIT